MKAIKPAGPEKPRSREIGEVMAELFVQIDKAAASFTKGLPISCTPGCHHCCKLLTSISMPEGFMLARHLLLKMDYKSLVPKLRATALENDYQGLTKGSYFAKEVRCAFLTEENLCSVYEQRPSCCRLHMVVTPPENCDPKAPRNTKTGAPDFSALESEVWKVARDFVRQNKFDDGPFNDILTAPIPIMVLHCMKLLMRDEPKVLAFLEDETKDVLSPADWLRRHAVGLMSDEKDVRVKMTAADLIQIGQQR